MARGRGNVLLQNVRTEDVMRITSKGQVTIPAAIRERAGFLPNTEVEFRMDGQAVRIVRSPQRPGRGRGERLRWRTGSSRSRARSPEARAISAVAKARALWPSWALSLVQSRASRRSTQRSARFWETTFSVGP